MLSALASVTTSADDYNMTQPYFYWGEAPFNVSEETPHNVSDDDGGGGTGVPVFPGYIRTTAMVLCLLILGVGVVGNVMVPLVILKSKDMRNSTNIFLLNLSVADLMVLLVCTPTVLVEVNSPPETWVLGQEMCKAVPFVEMTVAHASVLTILAISFERYYAICEPLKAGYVCTKARAMLICLMAWAVAAIFTSPIIGIAEYHYELYFDGSVVAVCLTQADTFWRALFFIFSNSFFFFVPLLILVVLYTIIARHLMTHPGIIANNNNSVSHVLRYRKQVVMMLGTVVVSFFICLLPFRALIFWIIIAPSETLYSLGAEAYYNLLFFCRIMFYLNSAVNPILYNLMSSKFRDGFMRLCGLRRRTSDLTHLGRRGTFNTTSTTTTTCSGNHRSSPESFWRRSVKSQRNSVKLFDAAKLSAPVGEVEKLMRNGSAARAAKCNNNKNNLIRPGLPEKCSCSITENGGSGVCSLQSHDESYV